MDNSLDRIPTNIRAIYWIKLRKGNIVSPKVLIQIGKQLSHELQLDPVYEYCHEFKNQEITLINLFLDSQLLLCGYPRQQLIRAEIFSVSGLSEIKINKAISKAFMQSEWVRSSFE